MTETEKMTKVERKAQKVKQAQAEYRKAVREQKKEERKAQDSHKYMMGGCVLKSCKSSSLIYTLSLFCNISRIAFARISGSAFPIFLTF